MNEADALLQSVLADPDADAPRLVYADWLEEHGEPERAEVIRTQVELARLPADDRRHRPLARREQALLTAHRDHWLADLGLLHPCEFRRGFVEHADLHATTFLTGADDLFRRTPLRSVRMALTRPDFLGALRMLASLPVLARLRELSFYGTEMGDEGARILAGSAYLHPTRLILRQHRLTSAAARALAASRTLTGLRELVLYANAITFDGAWALLRSPLRTTLQNLDLRRNRLSADDMAALRAEFAAVRV